MISRPGLQDRAGQCPGVAVYPKGGIKADELSSNPGWRAAAVVEVFAILVKVVDGRGFA